MHNSFVRRTHAPRHHVTQLNELKGLVGNPLELFEPISKSRKWFVESKIRACYA